MPRSGVARRLQLLSVCLVVPLLVACDSASPEQQALINFFRAARLRDTTTLSHIASVTFDPRTDGTVQKFSITNITPERRRTLQPPDRSGAVDSLTPPGQADVDLSKMNVDVVSKDVTVIADVRTPDGRTEPKTLVVTLQRAVGTDGAQTRQGRWIITAWSQRESVKRS